MKGTYILVINLHKNSRIQIGSLGIILFNKGYYFYVGSAMGAANSSTLINRVKRHISTNNKNLHWHIDYLLANINSIINHLYLIPTTERWECTIANELMGITNGYIKDFGSSDCNCISHLFYTKNSDSIGKE
ncbi:MAG: DUF123 domain-containing protein [Promethearchaeota archaeon]